MVGDPIDLIEVHGPDGQQFYVNGEQVTTLRAPIGSDRRHFPKGMHCVVVMSSGKFVPVAESCDQVHDLLIHPSSGTTTPGPQPERSPRQ